MICNQNEKKDNIGLGGYAHFQSVAYSGFLAPGVRSEIGAPFPDFPPQKISKMVVPPKKSSVRYHASAKLYTHFMNFFLNFSMISDKYVPNSWSIIFYIRSISTPP